MIKQECSDSNISNFQFFTFPIEIVSNMFLSYIFSEAQQLIILT